MTRNKRLNVAIAIAIAIALWIYVVGELDPSSVKKIKNIPITPLHTEVLSDRGLAVSSMTSQMLDIEVSGSRKAIANLEPGDISATVDLASASKGENEVHISVRVPNGITINNKSINNIKVMVESLVSKSVPVKIVYNGSFKDDEEGTTVSVQNKEVEVTGAESIVELVSYARGTVDASRVKDEESTNTCKLIPVSKDGNKVENVTLSKKSTTVSTILSKTKTVTLNVAISDYSSDGATRKTTVPKKVIIAGRSDVLKSITSVSADDVDISNISKNTDIDLEFSSLPEGVKISEKNSHLVVKVTVTQLGEKVIKIAKSEIKISGEQSNLKYEIQDLSFVTLTVTGDEEAVAKLKSSDFELVIDVSNAQKGDNQIQLSVNGDTKNFSVGLDPQFVNVKVSSK